jgi:hypothetical protein
MTYSTHPAPFGVQPWGPQAPPTPPYPAGPPVFTNNGIVATPPVGYGATGYPAPPTGPPPPRRRTGLIIGCVAAAASTAVIAGLVGWLVFGPNPDEDGIRAAMGDFTAAVAAGDLDGAANHVCAAEAAPMKGLHLPAVKPPADTAGSGGSAKPNLTDITIKNDLAVATNTTVADHPKIYFRKESGAWKVCVTAKAAFDAAAG